jgi:hypothetical protein
LLGKTAEDIEWLGKVAARHNEIICQAASSSAVLPLRLGTLFRSRESLQAMLVRCQPIVVKHLEQLGDRQEWGVKLYQERYRCDLPRGGAGPPPAHFPRPPQTGTAYLTEKKAQRDSLRQRRAGVEQIIRSVEKCLADKAEQCCRIGNLPDALTGRQEEMVFNAAFLLSSSAQASWLETVRNVDRDVQSKGLALEVSGPWPPYHFCPTLEF